MRNTAGSATAPAARCRNFRRGSFIAQPSQMNGSLHLDVGRPDHLAPLLRFVGDELVSLRVLPVMTPQPTRLQKPSKGPSVHIDVLNDPITRDSAEARGR